MKKKLLAIFVFVTSLALFAGCGFGSGDSSSDDSSNQDSVHTHVWATEWSKDESNHWYACVEDMCTEKNEMGAHQYPTDYEKDDVQHWQVCTECGYETVKVDHDWDEGVETTPSTGTTMGVKTFTCIFCEQTKTVDIPKLEQYIIQFDSDGGSNVEDVIVTIGDTIIESTLPVTERKGFEFHGWYAQDNNGEYTLKLGTDMTEVGDLGDDGATIIVKALWRKVFSVSFNTNGAGEIETQEVEALQKATMPDDPYKEGAIFTGWLKNGEKYDFDTEILEDIELTAAYETWTVEEYLSADSNSVVVLDSTVDDAEAYGGKAYKATLTGTATDTKGIKLTFGGEEGVDVSNYAHIFLRVKIINPVNLTNCTLRMGVNAEPVAGSQGYPYYDPVAAYSSDIYRHYISYDLKSMISGDVLKTVYLARTSQAITSGGQIEIYIDHVDFVEETLTLENVTGIVNNSQNKTYTLTEGEAYSQKDIIQTNNVNASRANWLGWDMDIYTGKYAFVGNFRQAINDALSNEMERALTLNFDNIDLTKYAHVYVKLKNYNTDPDQPASCTVTLNVNGTKWQNVPTTDWNKNDVVSGTMYTGYYEYDILSMAGCPETLTSLTLCRAGAVNGYQYGIMMYIESITFVPKMA